MISFYLNLIAWMPAALQVICTGVIAIFFIMAIVNLVRLILDLIPFL